MWISRRKTSHFFDQKSSFFQKKPWKIPYKIHLKIRGKIIRYVDFKEENVTFFHENKMNLKIRIDYPSYRYGLSMGKITKIGVKMSYFVITNTSIILLKTD